MLIDLLEHYTSTQWENIWRSHWATNSSWIFRAPDSLGTQGWWQTWNTKWWSVKSSRSDIMGWHLFNTMWKDHRVPGEWQDAMLVPMLMTGDLIRLLHVLGKLFAKFMHRRLRMIYDTLLDSQCGFHCARKCIDMILCTWQLTMKAGEHSTKVHYSSRKRTTEFQMKLFGWCSRNTAFLV